MFLAANEKQNLVTNYNSRLGVQPLIPSQELQYLRLVHADSKLLLIYIVLFHIYCDIKQNDGKGPRLGL